jgi:hypothetical protein
MQLSCLFQQWVDCYCIFFVDDSWFLFDFLCKSVVGSELNILNVSNLIETNFQPKLERMESITK